jgi:hypothetical protein
MRTSTRSREAADVADESQTPRMPRAEGPRKSGGGGRWPLPGRRAAVYAVAGARTFPVAKIS